MNPQRPYFPPPMHGLETIWRDKANLVMTKHAFLPSRCVKCNEPTGERLIRKLAWHHPAIYLTLFISLLVYAIIAMVVRKSATVELGFCEEHAAKRNKHLMITWALGIAGVLSFPFGAALEDVNTIAIGFLLLGATAIYGIVTLRVVIPTKIDDHFVWIKGVSAEYLQQFPMWRGGM